jgi:hypothetical protein
MRNVYQIRGPSTDQGTVSHVVTDQGFMCLFLELPWRDNKRSRSCIPGSTVYDVKLRISPKYGPVFHITDVEGRSWILTHAGNWAGDVDKGFRTHSEGCLLFGARKGLLKGQLAVFNSRSTKAAFEEHMGISSFVEGDVCFRLHIMEVW